MKKATRYLGWVFAALTVSGVGVATEKPAAPAGAAAGAAKGTFTVDGKTFTLAHASAFVDQKDERKPVIVIVTDQAVPATGWTSEFDFMRYRSGKTLGGVSFWLDKKGEVFRSEYYDGTPYPTATSGMFDLKLDGPMGKALAGSVSSTKGASSSSHKIALAATFSATVH